MSSSKPLVSVLVPCHNYGRFLGQAIDSILAQTLRDWECIIVDDGSSDDTEQVATRYRGIDARVRYIRQENAGVSSARNTALSLSRGQLIQFLDADDKIQPGKLESHADYLLSHPEVDLAYGGVDYFYEGDGSIATKVSDRMDFPNISASGERLLSHLVRRNIMVVDSPLIRRTAIDEVGLFDTGLRGHEDWEYWIRLALAGKTFHYVESRDSRALVRVHASSAVQDPTLMLLSNLQIRHELSRSALSPFLHRINRRGIGYQLVNLSKIRFRQGKYRAALQDAFESMCRSHADPSVMLALVIPAFLSTRFVIFWNRLARKFRRARR
jgi:glycosyltransferase involved in cell wall biosynthesis